MAIVSVRLNEKEEKILNYLTDYLHEDKSTLFRKSLFEMYEDIQDIKFIEQYIENSQIEKPTFISGEELLD
ncbi:MAG: hypothetical protein DRP60_11305 [Spirochaetes bacterium]|nr:MAG: hypothetical protein DRP60_11305 [Spirochaetota bacterium]